VRHWIGDDERLKLGDTRQRAPFGKDGPSNEGNATNMCDIETAFH
jgi:hypothetical protein